ncbi:hypothetical protein [Cupriavidus sp. H39]|uniref:hypothetical protein n=1 Tax=Cupriavidus sp. H39 TaxID=3401635 RepID=UPI003CFD76FB
MKTRLWKPIVFSVTVTTLLIWIFYELEQGRDRAIGYAAATLIPTLLFLTKERIAYYRNSDDVGRKRAKFLSDLSAIVSGISLAMAIISHSFDMEWTNGVSVMQRAAPALQVLHEAIRSPACASTESDRLRCADAQKILFQLKEEFELAKAESARKLLRRMKIYTEGTTNGSGSDNETKERLTVDEAIVALENELPPRPLLIKLGQQQILLLLILSFMLSTPTRIAISYVEWQESKARMVH